MQQGWHAQKCAYYNSTVHYDHSMPVGMCDTAVFLKKDTNTPNKIVFSPARRAPKSASNKQNYSQSVNQSVRCSQSVRRFKSNAGQPSWQSVAALRRALDMQMPLS